MSGLFSSTKELDVLMGLVAEHTTRIMACERSSVFLLDKEKNELYALVAQGLEVSELRFSINNGLAGFTAREGVLLNIKDAYQDSRFNPTIDRQTGFHTTSVLSLPMRDRRGHTLGVIQCLNKKGAAVFTRKDERLLEAVAALAAAHLESTALYQQMDKLFEAFVEAISHAIDDRDPSTSGHSRRVMRYALNLARAVHFCPEPPFAQINYTRDAFAAVALCRLVA